MRRSRLRGPTYGPAPPDPRTKSPRSTDCSSAIHGPPTALPSPATITAFYCTISPTPKPKSLLKYRKTAPSPIVGYNTLTTDGTRSPLIGLSFIPVQEGATATLGDFKPVDGTMIVDDDNLQVIDSTSLGTVAMYTYLDKATADAIAEEEGEEAGAYDELIGWWDAVLGVGEDGAAANDVVVKAGSGFMGLFESGNEISFVSAGSVPMTSTSVITDGTRSPIICSYIPKTITLGQIMPADGTMIVDDDNLQVIDSSSLGTVSMYTYLDKSTADAIAEEEGDDPGAYDELIGWWDAVLGVGEEGAEAYAVPVPAGTGFMGLFESGSEIQFQFPSTLD